MFYPILDVLIVLNIGYPDKFPKFIKKVPSYGRKKSSHTSSWYNYFIHILWVMEPILASWQNRIPLEPVLVGCMQTYKLQLCGLFLFIQYFKGVAHLAKMPVYHAALIKYNISQHIYIYTFDMDLKDLFVCLWVITEHLFLCHICGKNVC